MAKVILSVEEFLETFEAGDQLWFMTSAFDVPAAIRGPLTIARITTKSIDDNLEAPWVFFEDGRPGDRMYGHSVRDLTNRWHGVFLTKEDAQEYFEERKQAYRTDPDLIQEVKERKQRFRLTYRDPPGPLLS